MHRVPEKRQSGIFAGVSLPALACQGLVVVIGGFGMHVNPISVYTLPFEFQNRGKDK